MFTMVNKVEYLGANKPIFLCGIGCDHKKEMKDCEWIHRVDRLLDV